VSAGLSTFVVFGFGSVHDALFAEDALGSAGIPAAAIPSPKELGALCGIALRMHPADVEAAESVLALAGARVRARAEITDL
jgi:hypothetical protein